MSCCLSNSAACETETTSGCVVPATGLRLADASRPCGRRALHILLSQRELPVDLAALPPKVRRTLSLPSSRAHVRYRCFKYCHYHEQCCKCQCCGTLDSLLQQACRKGEVHL